MIFNKDFKELLQEERKKPLDEMDYKKVLILGLLAELREKDPHDIAINLLQLVSAVRFDTLPEFAEYLYTVADEKQLMAFYLGLQDIGGSHETSTNS